MKMRGERKILQVKRNRIIETRQVLNEPDTTIGVFIEDKDVLNKNIGIKYLLLCFLFLMVLIVGGLYNDSISLNNIPYQLAMFVICSMPFFIIGANPRHRLLAIFFVCYYLIFGMSNLFSIVLGLSSGSLASDSPLGNRLTFEFAEGLLSRSDLVVIFGAVSFLTGYFLYLKIRGAKTSKFLQHDWKPSTIFKMAIILWGIGFVFTAVYDMTVTPRYIPSHILGLPIGIASNLKQLSPIAGIMFIYLAVKGEYKTKLVWMILLFVISAEFVFGFIANSKEASFRIPALLMIGFFYIKGSFNKKLIIIFLLVSIPYIVFFNAYRSQVLQGAINQTQQEAVKSIDKNIDKVLKSTSKINNVLESSLGSLMNRFNGKIYVDIIVAGTDSGKVEYLDGESIILLFKTFVPRAFWADKPPASIGQKFNQEFGLSKSKFTFVPPTQLGEFYWNFSMPGVIAGMMMLGSIFGFISSKCLGGKVTLPRFIILLLATYYLALRFESNFALQYTKFIRLIVLIIIMDWFVKKLGRHMRLGSKS